MQIHNLLTGSFSPVAMDLSTLKKVRLTGYLIADGGDLFVPTDPKSEMRIQRVFMSAEGKVLLHTLAYSNGSLEFVYTLEEIRTEDLEAGNMPNVLPSIPMDELEAKAQEIRERLLARKTARHRRTQKSS